MSSINMVGLVAGVMVVFSLFGLLVRFMTGGALSVPSLVGLLLTCWLAWSLIQGSNIARWLAIFGMGLQGIAGVIGGVMLFSQSIGFGLLLVFIGLISVACAGALLFPPASEHFE